MGRTKGIPIDVNTFEAVNIIAENGCVDKIEIEAAGEDGRGLGDEPPIMDFKNDGTIRGVYGIRGRCRPNQCVEIKSTWLSQILNQDDGEWDVIQGSSVINTAQPVRRSIVNFRKERIRHQAELQDKYMEEYSSTSHAIRPCPSRLESRNKPKQSVVPPLNCILEKPPKRMHGKLIDGRMSLRDYWNESSEGLEEDTMARRCESTETEGTLVDIQMSDLHVDDQTDTVTDIIKNAQTDIMNDGYMADTSGNASDTETIIDDMSEIKVEEREDDSDYFNRTPAGRRAPAQTARASSGAMTVSGRACIACYERHTGCDRGLPRCTACASSGSRCVYPDVSPQVESCTF